MKNIFKDGYTIEKANGDKIELTGEDIRKISKAIDAEYGRSSIEYFIDIASDYEDEDVIRKAEEIANNDNHCANIWSNYWDNATWDDGGVEYDTVLDYVVSLLREER